MCYNKYILKGAKVLLENDYKVIDIAIEDGIIIALDNGLHLAGYEEIDCENKIITPGFTDVHVHFRDPGYEYKEDIMTGSKSAIKGGYTTVFTMPNTNPCMDNCTEIQKYIERVKQAYCEIIPYSAITCDLKGGKLVNINEISKLEICGFTDDGKGIQDEIIMKNALKDIKDSNKIVVIHSEDESEIKSKESCINEGIISEKYNLDGINNKSEYNMLKRDIKLLKGVGGKYHLCHVSTKESVDLIYEAKKDGLDISCEVSPHHLVLNEMDIKEDKRTLLDTNYKMNPPLRSKKDQQALIDGLNKGTISIIATDHAPHSKEEKAVNIKNAAFGIIGLEQSYSVLNTYLINNGLVKEEIVLRALTYNPSRRFNMAKNIQVDAKVNLVILDPNEAVIFTKNNTESKSENSPFMNCKLQGKVCMTLIDDKQYFW